MLPLCAPEWYLRSPLHMRWYAHRLGLSGHLRHPGRVEPDAEGRPGARCLFPARPVYGTVNSDDTRTDFQVLLSRRGSVLLVVCAEPASAPDAHWERSVTALVNLAAMGARVIAPLTRTRLCGLEAVAHTLEWGDARIQHEWKLIAHGWLYYFGVVQRRNDSGDVLDLAMHALDTWRWVPPLVSAEEANRSGGPERPPGGAGWADAGMGQSAP